MHIIIDKHVRIVDQVLNYRTGSSIYASQVYTFLEKNEINILKSDCNRRSWSSQYQRTILYERTVLNLKSYITWNNNIQKRNFTRRISSHVFFFLQPCAYQYSRHSFRNCVANGPQTLTVHKSKLFLKTGLQNVPSLAKKM